jgi:hypothetical protein
MVWFHRSPFVLCWRRALFLSVLLHAAIALFLGLLPNRGNETRPTDSSAWFVAAPVADVGAAFDVSRVDEDPPLLKPPFPAPQPSEPESPPTPVESADPLTVPEASAQTGAPSPPHHETADPGLEGQGRGTGAGAAPDFFALPSEAKSVVYVIDGSASMGLNGAFAAARKELLASLDRLPPTVRFQIIVYSSDAHTLRLSGRTELAEASVENKTQAAQQLAELPLEGRTVHLPALKKALALGAEVIFFLTDADDLSAAEVREVTRLNRLRRVIHTIELSTANRDRPEMPLQVLARENGGTYRAVDVGNDE